MRRKPVVIGVAGGSGSGKTSVTKAIYESFKGHSILMIEQDYYYKDQSRIYHLKRGLKPIMIIRLPLIMILLIEHIEKLLRHEAIEKPVYDYSIHTSSDEVQSC